MATSPLEPHAVSAAELAERNAAARRGTPFLVYLDGERRQVIVDLERVGGQWTVVDDGLSRHGTYVRGERIDGRRRLVDGDLIGAGNCVLAFCDPHPDFPATTAPIMTAAAPASALTPAQRRVLVELCRPLLDGSGAGPAGNPRIAEALVVTVDAVKHRLGELYDTFALDKLPQNEKRMALAAAAVRAGIVTRRDL